MSLGQHYGLPGYMIKNSRKSYKQLLEHIKKTRKCRLALSSPWEHNKKDSREICKQVLGTYIKGPKIVGRHYNLPRHTVNETHATNSLELKTSISIMTTTSAKIRGCANDNFTFKEQLYARQKY